MNRYEHLTSKFINVKLQEAPLSTVTIFEDSKGNIWVGGFRRLTFLLKRGDSKFRQIPLEPKEGLRAGERGSVFTITEDNSGNIWLGGHELGIKRFNPQRNVFEDINIPDLYTYSTSILGMMSDQQNRLWLGMVGGLTLFDIKNNHVSHFGAIDGIALDEFTFNSTYTGKDGYMFFGSNKGLLHFNPNEIKINADGAKILITGLAVNDTIVTPGDSSEILTEELQYLKKITLDHDQNFFKIAFSLLNYILPEKNAYEYRIGEKGHWHKTSNPWVTFNNIAPGTYQLFVRGYNNDNVMSASPAELTIVIKNPWYQTWWAYMIYALILLGIIGTIVRLFWIKASYGQALELNQYKLDFFTNISHEIRTNLSLIIAPLDKIKQNMNVQENVSLAQNNANKLLQLVTELMDFRKLESAEVALHVQEHDIVATVASQLSNFEHAARQKELTISLSSVSEKVMVYFDAYQIGKAISNLISNALKFVDPHGIIEIVIEENDKSVFIKIIDDGKGIAPEHMSKIFENYFQVYEYGDKNTGYGIGLTLSKGIVTLHHGTITAQTLTDADGKNSRTCFEITLPKGSDHFTPAQLKSVQDALHKPTVIQDVTGNVENLTIPDGEFETILIAEDNFELRKFIASCFPQYRIIEAPNGQNALEQTLDQMPDLIITDVMMPGMSGTELCSILKQDERTCHIPVVMLTAMVSEEQIITGLESQADHYITKPFNTKELELKVINLLNLRNAVRERIKNSKNLGEVEKTLSNIRDKEFINKLAAIVESNISKSDFGVEELAREIGMGKTVLYKKLKAATGMSVNDFIKMLRLSHAANLLQEDVYNINEVADLVGFNDRRYFSREFARVMGKTPSTYAKEHKK